MPQAPLRSLRFANILLGLVGATLVGGCGSDAGSGTQPPPVSRLVIAEFLFRGGVDTLEWIELRNDGLAAAPLAGVSIPAVGYRFPTGTPALPSGRRLLLVNDPSLFATSHPGIPVFGVFPGRLADEGEELALKGTDDEGFSVVWNGTEPWPQGAIHLGRSMVWIGGDPRVATSWAASAIAGGEPGAGETPAADPGIQVSEVMPRTSAGNAFVELASKVDQAVDIGGWWLVLDGDAADTLTIPVGTTIPAGGRLVFAPSAVAPSLDLGTLEPRSEEGRILLVARRADGNPTGFANTLSWEAVPEGSSVARFDVWGTGILAMPTPGTGETRLPAPSAFIAEICFHPATGAEYLEIASLVDTAIPLGNALDSNLSWKLDGAGLRFGVGDTLPARGRLVAVAFQDVSPETFRAQHAIASTTPVVGFSGRLDNAGERMVLGIPNVAVTTASGSLRWKTRPIDEVAWLPVAPWPFDADGGGACLERVDPTLPGNSPTAWRAAQPSPGI